VCGVLFSTLRGRDELKPERIETGEDFDMFWEMVDTLLNSVLYVIMGLSFVRVLQMPFVLRLSIAAILCNLISRFVSLFASTFLIGTIPDGFDRKGFSFLFTWGGLRGGLSIGLAMSTALLLPEENYHILLGCVYAIVFFTTVVQGLSMKKVFQSIKRK
jgi:CPA1 family monovalent cation:H+ antiporter